jgi:hypothetical protein
MGWVTAQTFHHTIRGALTHEECQRSAALRQNFTQSLEKMSDPATTRSGQTPPGGRWLTLRLPLWRGALNRIALPALNLKQVVLGPIVRR